MKVFLHVFILVLLLSIMSKERRHEQHVSLKFLTKSGLKAVDCWRKLKDVFGGETMSESQARVWWRRFKNGQEETADRPKTGRPHSKRTCPNIARIQQLVQEDGRRSIRGLAGVTGMSRGTVWTIVKKDLKLHRRSARMVPHLLTEEQKAFWKRICEENLALIRENPEENLTHIITCDET